MTLTIDTDSEPTATAVVTMRIPNGGDCDLFTDATERLARAEDIDGVTIDELHSLDPKLSATVITVEITLRSATILTDGAVRERLTDVSGLESIERIE